MTHLTQRLNASISSVLHIKICVMLGVQTITEWNYVVVFSTFPIVKNDGFKAICHEIQPLRKETARYLNEQIHVLSIVMSVFGPSFDNVASLAGDNYAVIQTVANLFRKPLFWCARHRF